MNPFQDFIDLAKELGAIQTLQTAARFSSDREAAAALELMKENLPNFVFRIVNLRELNWVQVNWK